MLHLRYIVIAVLAVFTGTLFGQVAHKNQSHSHQLSRGFEDMESSLVLEITLGITGGAVRGIRSAATLLQYSSDTLASFFSASTKSMGSLIKFGDGVVKDNCILMMGTQLHLTAENPNVILHRMLCVCFRYLSRWIGFLSHAFLLAGDVNEAIFVGLSRSINDSIQGLVFMLVQIRSGIELLLLPTLLQESRKNLNRCDMSYKDSYQDLDEVPLHNENEVAKVDEEMLSLKIQNVYSAHLRADLNDGESKEKDTSSSDDNNNIQKTWSFVPPLGTTFSFVLAMALAYMWGSFPFKQTHYRKMLFIIIMTAIGGAHFALQRSEHAILYHEYALLGVHDHIKSLQYNSVQNRSWQNIERTAWEQSIWANTLIRSLWGQTTRDTTQTQNGDERKRQPTEKGLGSYASDIISQVIHDEIATFPDGLGNLKLLRFNLGDDAPLVKAIRCSEGKKEVCLKGDLSCVYAIIDTQISFVSQNVDMSFTMKSKDINTKSLLPEVSIIISEIFFVGTVRVSADIIPSYPFFGNATVGFLDTPVCDIVITLGPEFRNIHLSSVPGVQQLVKSSLEWTMSQYLYPSYGIFDLGKLLCPSCDNEHVYTDTVSKDHRAWEVPHIVYLFFNRLLKFHKY
jgi:hypothetical protein